MKEKKKAGKALLIICFLLIFALIFWYIQNYTFVITETEIYSDNVSSEIRVVQLSDLHGANYGDNNSRLVSAVKDQIPDIICVTGDMYTNGDSEGMDTAHGLMKQLVSVAPVYFVPGEHDSDSAFLAEIESYGVKVLRYEKATVEIRGNRVTVYGIDNVYYTDTFNLFREFDKPSDDSLNLLLAHIPNFDAFNWFGPDISICGDTHGGVVQLPFVGPLYFNDNWFPQLTSDEQYVTDKGLFQTYTGYVYVSGGLGNYPYPVRLFNRPELSVLTVLPKE